EGTLRGRPEDAGPRARAALRARQGLPSGDARSMAAAERKPRATAGPGGLSRPEHAVSVRPGHEALPGEGRRSPLQRGEGLPLVSRLPGGRAIAALVAPLLPLERPRL